MLLSQEIAQKIDEYEAKNANYPSLILLCPKTKATLDFEATRFATNTQAKDYNTINGIEFDVCEVISGYSLHDEEEAYYYKAGKARRIELEVKHPEWYQ